jgi:hypothetical protein
MDTKLTRKIQINGKEYASTDEMPPEIRALYEKAMETFADRDGNQVPDFLEGKGPGVWQSAKQMWSLASEARKIGINQVTFSGGDPIDVKTRSPTVGESARGEAPRVEAPRAEAPTFSIPTTSSPLEPTVAGGGARSFFVLIALIGGALYIARQLGWF